MHQTQRHRPIQVPLGKILSLQGSEDTYQTDVVRIDGQEREGVKRGGQLPVNAGPGLIVDCPFQNENNGVQHAVFSLELRQFAVCA